MILLIYLTGTSHYIYCYEGEEEIREHGRRRRKDEGVIYLFKDYLPMPLVTRQWSSDEGKETTKPDCQ